MTDLQNQIQALIEEHERIKSNISWIEWYQTGSNAQREIDELESEIALLRTRVVSVKKNQNDTKTIPVLRERAKFVLEKIMSLEEQEKLERETLKPRKPRVSAGPRVGELSAERSREIAENLGMTIEELVEIMKGK